MSNVEAGKLRHRVQVQAQAEIRDPATGAMEILWVNVGVPVWASIEPLSAREFIQSASEQNKITARITMRHRNDLQPSMRILHRGITYNIAGLLPDKDSGLEYITIPVSYGVNDGR